MTTVQLDVKSIRVNPSNPRVVKDDKFKKLVQSIKDFPQMLELRPIVVDDKQMILGGNMRYKACIEAGMTSVPVVLASDLTEDQKREFIIKDNVGFGEWDWDQLKAWDLEKLDAWGLDVPDYVADATEAVDDNYEIPAGIETSIEQGDVFEIGIHRLMCGDSTSPTDVEALMGGLKADMVMTDPPYNVDYTGGTSAKMKIMNDSMDDSSFYEFLLAFYRAFAEVTKDGGAWYVWHADSEGANFRKAFRDSGLLLKQCLVWVKNSMVMGRQDYQWKHEPCLYGWKKGDSHYFVDSRRNTTVIEDKIDPKKMKKDELVRLVSEMLSDRIATTVLREDKPLKNDLHPTMKPITLLAPLIQNSSRPGELVADPFLGSGSTMVAAQQLKRRCFGMELDPQYCQVVLDRMTKLDPSISIKKNGQMYQKQ